MTGGRRLLAANIGARLGALAALGVATVVVARTSGAGEVGVYALLRVLPGLVGVLVSCGLPGATAFFLAGEEGRDARMRPTLVALMVGWGIAGALVWVALSPLLHHVFFGEMTLGLVAITGTAVFTQLLVAVGKSCLQGEHDLPGANAVILWEEAAFLPAFGLLALAGMRGVPLLIAALILADVVVAAGAWRRLLRRQFAAFASRPSRRLATRVSAYGLRGQVGGLLSLLNLRLDFALLGALAGPAVLGTYAVASKYAELLRLPGLAVTYVLYPRYARDGRVTAARQARGLLRRAWVFNAAAAVPLALAAGVILPVLYGAEFRSAVLPAYILVAGLVGESATGVATAYLYGAGRPGTNSVAVGAGLVVTAVLDVVLIPRYGAVGAAVASCAAYLVTTAAVLVAFQRLLPDEVRVPAKVVAVP